MSPRPKPQPEWMARVQVGDVLTNGRAYRVVREVSRWRYERPARGRRRRVLDEGPLRGVSFTIKHCSWTGRCYTVLTATDLLQRQFRPAGVRVKLTKALDAEIAQNITDRVRTLRCCDVRGIA